MLLRVVICLVNMGLFSEDMEGGLNQKSRLAKFISNHSGPIGALAIYVLATPLAILATMHQESHREKARNAIEERRGLFVESMAVADYDGEMDGVMSNREWGVVYKSVNLVYDPRFSDPGRDLTNEQLKTYLKTHGDSLPASSPVRGYIDGLEK